MSVLHGPAFAERYRGDYSTIYEGDARNVAACQEPGSFSLAIFDGAYGYGKGDWDRVSLDELADWYRPHFEDADRLLAPSASLYVWNTAAGWARLDPVLREMGWTERSLIVWDKVNTGAMLGHASMVEWPDTTEVCGHYTRGDASSQIPASVGTVWRMAAPTYRSERLYRPGLVPAKIGGGLVRSVLHPSQKPVAFSERILRASLEPQGRAWIPFGGTCREAWAAELIGHADPAQGRFTVTAELNRDGVDYLGPVIEQIKGGGNPTTRAPGQASLFAPARSAR